MESNGLSNRARRSGRKQLAGGLEHCLVTPHCSAGLHDYANMPLVALTIANGFYTTLFYGN